MAVCLWFVGSEYLFYFLFICSVFRTYTSVIPDITKYGFIAGIILTFIGILTMNLVMFLFLTDFVVPIMYKHQISALKAWSVFLSLMFRNMCSFFVYGLFILILKIATAIAVIFVAVLTCCIGLLLIMIPFVGTVILLPVSYTFRAFSLEYFATFGDEFNLFHHDENMISENIQTK